MQHVLGLDALHRGMRDELLVFVKNAPNYAGPVSAARAHQLHHREPHG